MKHVADERNDFKARLETTLKDLEVATDPVMSKRWSEIVIRT
jgi:TATA-binding protein-associated factor Taf7